MRRSGFIPRRLFCLVAAGILFACASAERASAEPSPYEARVVATGAPILSGPGENYYPTDTLAQGDVVEVYREKSGGWLAIRPPLNSFSWVPGSDLKKQDDGLAEIVKDNVASRIGSRLNDKRNAAQVRLKKGELVEVLDEEKFGDETWYKIAPPAGEFRWIQAALVERAELVKTASAETPVTEASAPPLIAKTQASSAIPAQPQATAPATTLPTATGPVAPPTAAAAPVAPPPSGPVADDLSRSLTEIELRLSRMVSAPVNLWNTERLERDTAQLLTRAQTTADRDAVQVTKNKISRFAQIAHRANPSGATTAQSAPAGQTPQQQAGVAATAPGGPYDATGILRPVVSRRPGAPQFALVDERGQVLSFITPTPDVNLQPYLGHRVGVVGNKGYIAEFNRSHVTAARVMPLNDKMVR